MTYNRIGNYCLFFLILALAVNLLRVLLRPVNAQGLQPTPCTVILQQSAIDKDGKATAVNVHTLAVRSDGSIARKVSGPVGHESESDLRILDFSSKIHVDIRDLWELKSTRSSSSTPPLRDPNSSCLYSPNIQETVLGQEAVGGYRAVKLGKGGRTSWYALEYGCALVKERMEFDTGEVSEKALIGLIAGEPERALFHVPDTYKEVPPSQIAIRHGATSASQNAGIERLDREYFDHLSFSQPAPEPADAAALRRRDARTDGGARPPRGSQ